MQRATITMVKGGQGASTYGGQNLGMPRLCVHAYTARRSEPLHVVLGLKLLMCEAHSLTW